MLGEFLLRSETLLSHRAFALIMGAQVPIGCNIGDPHLAVSDAVVDFDGGSTFCFLFL